jgi:uncharacterized protein
MPKPAIAALVATAVCLCHAQTADPAARARQFLELLSKRDGAGAAALLTAQMKPILPPDKLSQIWQGLVTQAGAFRQFVGARIEASDSADVVFVTCEFEKLKLDARIPVNKEGLVSGLNFGVHSDYTPPAYVKSSSFHEKDVIVGQGEWSLHGTLTIPNGTGPFPALILVHGSGPSDRDEALGPNKPFRDIAWGVASRGVAVLRYNKRSYEHPMSAKVANLTLNEEARDDAVSAAALLRGLPEINPQKIFVLGHSIGAVVAPRIGKADPAIAGLILEGGVARPYLDLLLTQIAHNQTADGSANAAAEKQIEELKQQIARANDPDLKPGDAASGLPFGAPASYWLDVRGYRPVQLASQLQVPMLILQGERDYQATMEDFALWKQALSDRKNVEFEVYPKLNHFFIEGEGVSSDAEYLKPGHVSAAVVEDIARWIARQAK